MTICPHCKKQFTAKQMEIELIEGIEEGGMRLGKVAYSCPYCHVFLAVGETGPFDGGAAMLGMGMQGMANSGGL